MINQTEFILLSNNFLLKDCSHLKLTKRFLFLWFLVKPVLKIIFLQPVAEIKSESQKITAG